MQEAETEMIAATLKVLTWGTVATAVVSAILLAAGDGGTLRAERAADASASPSAPLPATGPASVRNGAAASTGPTDLRH